MVAPDGPSDGQPRRPRGVLLVLAVQAASALLVAGWFVTGHASAPDAGLLQIALLSLDEPVPGLSAVDGRPTMVVLTGQGCPPQVGRQRHLDARYGLILSPDRELARRLSLPYAAERCQPGYVLLDADSNVRYRTYDPAWAEHAQEQEILLENLEPAARPHR